MKFLITAAGTGGHVFPALEFARECIDQKHKVVWVGTTKGFESKIVPEHDIPFLIISMSGFRGKGLLDQIKSIIRLAISTIKTIFYIFRHRINFVVCFGGYVSLPVGIAAIICRKYLILHEQNSVLGTANKLLTRFAKIVFLGFPLHQGKKKNMQIVGNPIRAFHTNQDLNTATSETFKIYVTGGSQGSEFINKNIPIAINSLGVSMNIKHQSGINKSEGVKDLYSSNIRVEVAEFYQSPQEIIRWSDFVICRAGALTLSEVSSLGRGCLMIPLPSSIDNHQLLNAQEISNLKKGLIHEEHESLDLLSNRLQKIYNKKLYLNWQNPVSKIDHLQASKRMLSSILKIT